MIRNRIRPLEEKKNLLALRLNRAGADVPATEKRAWVDEIEELNQRITYTISLPDEQLFDGDYTAVDWQGMSGEPVVSGP